MTDRRLPVAAAVVLALVAAVYLWPGRSTDPTPDAAPIAPPATNAGPMAGATPDLAAAAPPRPARQPLPPPGTPIAQIADSLKIRADRGDSQAACRLAMELVRCQRLEESKSMQWFGGPPDVMLEQRGNLEAADRFAEMQIRAIELLQQCQALDPALLAQAPAYLAAAARAGEPEAMLHFALGSHHGGSGGNFMADPDFDRWRRESPAMLLRAAQAGRMDALSPLAFAYRSDRAPFAGLVPDDPVQAHAWDLVLSRLRGTPEPAFEAPDAAVAAQAATLAAQWHQRYFDGAVVGNQPELQPQSLDLPMRPPEEVVFCE
jgi:hypothetical protein